MLAKWLARRGAKKQRVAGEHRCETNFTLESLEPRLLLSAVIESEDSYRLPGNVDPALNIGPIASIQVDSPACESSTDVEPDLPQLSLTVSVPDEDSQTDPVDDAVERSPTQDGSVAVSSCSVAFTAEDTGLLVDDGVSELQAPVEYDPSNLPSSTEELIDTLHAPNPPPQEADLLTVTASGTINVWDLDPASLAESGIRGLIIQGADDTDDTLIVDLSRGDLPLPVTFHGGAGGYDMLVISGMAVGSYTPGQVLGDGSIQASATSISFTGLEPVFIDGASPAISTFTFTTPLSADVITIDR